MNRIKKIVSFILFAVMMFSVSPLAEFAGFDLSQLGLLFIKADAATYSGTCGSNLSWTLDDSTGELVISGTGNMSSWSDEEDVPWYEKRAYIKSVVFPDGITSIGQYAFYNCKNLAEIVIPEGVTSIGKFSFYMCYGLKKAIIPGTVSAIDAYAFGACRLLENVTISDGVKTIGENVFYDCDKLTSIKIPKSVTSILKEAFSLCHGLEKITVDAANLNYSNDEYGVLFDKNKTTLIQYPLGNSRTEYIIPNTVTTIGHEAFAYCSKLFNITITENVTSIGEDAFQSANNLTVVKDNPAYSSDENGVLFNKNKTVLILYPSRNSRTEYVIPDSVKEIAYDAFYLSDNLAKVIISNNVETIGEWAFGSCDGLTDIIIPESVKTIGKFAFYSCNSLADISIPDGITKIGSRAFENTKFYKTAANWTNNALYIGNCLIELKEETTGSFQIRNGTVLIADKAFYYQNITSVTFPEGLKFIGDMAFYGCTKAFTDLVIPDSVVSIGNEAFCYCESINTIALGNSLESIGDRAFFTITSDVFEIHLPKSLKSIGIQITNETHAELIADKESPYFSNDEYGVLFNKDKTVLVNYYNLAPMNYKIPDGVITIRSGAFSGIKVINSLFIPKTVKVIEKDAFNIYSALYTLKHVYYEGTEEEWEKIEKPSGNNDLTSATLHFNNCSGYGDIFKFDAEHHWKECDCGIKISLADHKFNDDNVCSCGYHKYCNAKIAIKNNSGSATVNYGETLVLTAVVTEKPADAFVAWYVDGVLTGASETFNVSFESGSKEITVKLIDANGDAIIGEDGNEISDTETVTVNSSFWLKIVNFFKTLFGISRTVIQTLKQH